MKGAIKAIVFDIGGVLQINFSKRKNKDQTHVSGVHEIIAKKLGTSIDQYFDAIDSSYVKSMEGKISEKKLLETFSKNLKTPKEKIKKLYYFAYKKRFKLNKPLLRLALKLKEEGYKISILSDQWHLSKKAHVPKKFYLYFKPLLLSCDVGFRKPNEEVYRLLLKKLKLLPKNILFIDNQIWNVLAAEEQGMNTILFKDNKDFFKKLKKFI